MPTHPLTTTVDEVLGRLIARLDHRWKQQASELPSTALSYGFLASCSVEPAVVWEVLTDISEFNDIANLRDVPLDLELADYDLVITENWDNDTKLWWLKLHLMLYSSAGLIPEIKFLLAFLFWGKQYTGEWNPADVYAWLKQYAAQIEVVNNYCPICMYYEPAFYTINFPVAWLSNIAAEDYMRWDPNDDDELHEAPSNGWGTGRWYEGEQDWAATTLTFLRRATAAGVRFNALGTQGFQWDPAGDDELHETEEHGWDTGRWNGAIEELLREYSLLPEYQAWFHVCQKSEDEFPWESIADLPPQQPFQWDPTLDDELHRSMTRGWGFGAWVENDED